MLLRRALVPDTLPGGYEVARGQDVMISVYNIHHSPQVGNDLGVGPRGGGRLREGKGEGVSM